MKYNVASSNNASDEELDRVWAEIRAAQLEEGVDETRALPKVRPRG